jgi:hypothetical protein
VRAGWPEPTRATSDLLPAIPTEHHIDRETVRAFTVAALRVAVAEPEPVMPCTASTIDRVADPSEVDTPRESARVDTDDEHASTRRRARTRYLSGAAFKRRGA